MFQKITITAAALSISLASPALALTAFDTYKFVGIAYTVDHLCGNKTFTNNIPAALAMTGVTKDDMEENIQIIENWAASAEREARRKGIRKWCAEMRD